MTWRKSSFNCWTSYSCYSPPEICITFGWSFQCMNPRMRVFTDTNSSLGRSSSILKVAQCPVEQPTSPWRTAKEAGLTRLTAACEQAPASPPEWSCIHSLIIKCFYLVQIQPSNILLSLKCCMSTDIVLGPYPAFYMFQNCCSNPISKPKPSNVTQLVRLNTRLR